MKTIKLKWYTIIVIIGVQLFCSCSNDVEHFSCDKEIDGWVKENLGEIRRMNREEWLNSSWVYSKAIYRAFTPEQKLIFWNEKFNEIVKLNWSEEECAHIELARNFINSHVDLFEDGNLTDEQLDVLESFFYKWKTTAERDFHWNLKIIKSIAACGHRVKNTKGDLDKLPTGTVSQLMVAKAEGDCKCNANYGSDFCGITNEGACEKSNNCEETDKGCGWIGLQKCNGICVY